MSGQADFSWATTEDQITTGNMEKLPTETSQQYLGRLLTLEGVSDARIQAATALVTSEQVSNTASAASSLVVHSGNCWKETDLEALKIEFANFSAVDFMKELQVSEPEPELSGYAKNLLTEMEKLHPTLSIDKLYTLMETSRQQGDESVVVAKENDVNIKEYDEILKNPLVKATYFVRKYANQESAVDSFMQILLYKLGFYDDWLYAFPQFKLPLKYGSIKKEATADFTLMDVLSFHRMAVVEDKRFQDFLLNSEPQLIAEAIAAHQSNIEKKKKRKASAMETTSSIQSDQNAALADEIIGVRLNGCVFYFYIIPVSSDILHAMNSVKVAENSTYIKRSPLLDWCNPNDRIDIIKILDRIRMKLVEDGTKALRRDSFGKSGISK